MLISEGLKLDPALTYAAWSAYAFFALGMFHRIAQLFGWGPDRLHRDKSNAALEKLEAGFEAKLNEVWKHLHEERRQLTEDLKETTKRIETLTVRISEIVGKISVWERQKNS